MAAKVLRKILWCLDVFEERSPQWQESQVGLLRELGRQIKVSIEPLHVLTPNDLNLPLRFNRDWAKKYRRPTENAMKGFLSQLTLPGLKEPTVLVQNVPSRLLTAKRVSSYGQKSAADLICLSTHSRKGLPRLLLGSFAESLLMTSKIPLLITHPHAPSRAVQKILFPTDLDRKSLGVFRKVLAFARDLEAELILMHVVKHPMEPVVQSGVLLLGGGFVTLSSLHEREIESQEGEARKWQAEAVKSGVKCQMQVITAEGSVTEAILEQAQQTDCQLIALAAQSGVMASTWVGSISRQVVREANCPVWIVRR